MTEHITCQTRMCALRYDMSEKGQTAISQFVNQLNCRQRLQSRSRQLSISEDLWVRGRVLRLLGQTAECVCLRAHRSAV